MLILGKSYVLLEEDLLEKAATMKRFEYFSLVKEIKAKTDITNKQDKKFGNDFKSDKTIKKETPTLKKHKISSLIYISKYSFFFENYNIKNFNSLSLTSKYPNLFLFYSDLNKFNDLNPQKESIKGKKALCMIML